MSSISPQAVLAAPPQVPTDDIREFLRGAECVVKEVILGTHERIDFSRSHLIVIVVGETLAFAAAQTRLWRAEMGDRSIPILWLLPFSSPELTVTGLDAGADTCLARPLDPAVFAAQIRAMLRHQHCLTRLWSRAAEARQLNEQLQQAYHAMDQAYDLTRRVQRSLLPRRLPVMDGIRFAVHYRPRSRVGGDLYDVVRLDEYHVGFWLADVGGPGSPASGMLGLIVKHAIQMKEIHQGGYRLVPPDEVLTRVNRELLALELDPPALAGVICGQLDTRTGAVALARGGLPPTLYQTNAGTMETWNGPGSHLGAYEADFILQFGKIGPGERLLLFTDGAKLTQEPDPLPSIVNRHAQLTGQAFTDAVVHDLLQLVHNPDDLTLLVVEHEPHNLSASIA
ncbi:MAG: SpoIIE family protein phosphatase [Bacteroidales bacterium]|nr:SpoIIE family protein phosphatase [Bacteroidales bacterium]